MKLSLINVYAELDGQVQGTWLQNYVGTIEDARVLAKELEAANGGRINVAVVEEIPSSRPDLGFWRNLKAL